MPFVYRLFDKRNPATTRYIGVTSNPTARFAQHLLCDGSNPGKDAWIQEVGLQVGIEVIETTATSKEGREREAYWIHFYLAAGEPLTNIRVPSQEIRLDDGVYWKIGLPNDSKALADVDALCKATGLQRGEVSRMILMEWLAANRGNVQALLSFIAL